MFSNYKPTWMVDAIYKVTPEQLNKHGIKAVLTDLDNTLIAWNNPDGTDELRIWLESMKKANIPVIVVSNNNAERVGRALQAFELDYVARALKPFAKGINKACKDLGVEKDAIVMVGDQIMTDIRAANRSGVKSILVRPVIDTDSWKTQLNRMMERKIMKYLLNKHPEMKWQGEIK
ncbi:YqeG family HAD IIIA-type phosphatase [Enterococcus saccharolyticus]|uniref:HAD phosphatase, family IIIA n=1 Tax=Enterococcus saccharolyticus subsp. saccharolyticus ATCC 43076 TaxID=1139996 RepID=S0NIU9_9ENTE|nr:YqeG family HAD IIIA-type phosphatase [Enterococcus saccharolyticus]EOT29051.1 HAD phosphatase, family IIIA [Enterococcus saccharolyticus subsp. saccharolyticus ATCC 43076]EOT81417.1 HAD phosphatase, family IIIA [Enterococcus saccharolyticus subsp. saccharolyticus ATCC 43076]OJG86694.1 HAD phosphatase, family IIIA [Enterococcus saccharolyticus]